MKKPVLLVAMGATLLLGCETLGRLDLQIERPEVTVESIAPTRLSFSDAEITTSLRVTNPNAAGIRLTGFSYVVEVEGGEFLSGDQSEGLDIAGFGQTSVEFPVVIGFPGLIDGVRAVRGKHEVEVAVSVELRFDLPVLGAVRMPVQQAVTMPVVRPPRLRATELVLDSITLSGARLELTVRFENPNGFALRLDSVAYAFSVRGQTWVAGQTETPRVVAPGAAHDIAIPMTISFTAFGRTVREILLDEAPIAYALVARADLRPQLDLLPPVVLPFESEGRLELRRR